MLIKPKLFLSFSAFCITPLLILSLINFRGALRNTESQLRENLADDLRTVTRHYEILVGARYQELTTLARGPLPNYISRARTAETIALIDPARGEAVSGPAADAAYAARAAIINLPLHGLYYPEIAVYDSDKRLMFLVQPVYETPIFRTKDFLPGVIQPDQRVWAAHDDVPLCAIVTQPIFGDVRRCSVPVFLTNDHSSGSLRGVLVADIRLDLLFEGAGKGREGENTAPTRSVIALNSLGGIIYHPNDALRHQQIDRVMPSFAPIASAMLAQKEGGTGEYRSPEGERWLVAYEPIDLPGLSLAIARNYSVVSQPVRRIGWWEIGLSILLGFAAATLLSAYLQKRTQRIQRITESVAAIAGGDLDQRLDVRSRDDMRLIADGVNAMRERLREQIAREAEDRQFESFVKLSAMLTHDLKNAIEGLSLTVSNMERHFDKPDFRADTMKSLAGATDKLRALVTRLSNPVNTLSGEFKMPRPTDLVPLLNRVLAQNAEPLRGQHEIEINLPSSLFAMVDGERIEKVMENLIINALEAMSGKSGKLTVEAGQTDGEKVHFRVSDTGVGMSQEFIQKRLYRPFSTTRNRGVGLGLYTCREVVRANGGSIEVESVEGSGTTFRVVLASASNRIR